MVESSRGNVLITGAGAGIGELTVRLLVRRGYLVFAGVRGAAPSLTDLPGVRVVPLDVTDSGSVAAAAELVRREVGPAGLRAVVNNAGVIVQGPLELVPPAELRRQFEVNTFGPAYMVQAFLPLLRDGGGRVVNISAPSARIPIPFMAPISASKAALASMSDALRVELAAWNIPVVVVEPAAAATAIFAKASSAAQEALAATDPDRVALYRDHLAAFAAAAAKQKLGPAEAIAEVVVTAVTAERPKRRYAAGRGARAFGAVAHLPGRLRDRLITGVFGLRNVQAGAR
ncbi:MAG TPA: SDR family NAD(P)-dependent oxidoreductase [Mycobacteriales bacterium]|nr:SDR family NAD(P)-dependent oxidoreductase [Mycobacteriales bacterium]